MTDTSAPSRYPKIRSITGEEYPSIDELMTRPCERCGAEFRAITKNNRFCSKRCRNDSYAAPFLRHTGLSTGEIGAIGELRVCVDLLTRGYEVFRSVSAACSCDLVAHKDNKMLKVEVRTCHINPHTGKILLVAKDKTKYDVYAAVLPDRIEYIPPIP